MIEYRYTGDLTELVSLWEQEFFGLRYVSVCACRSGFKDLFLSGLRRRGLSYQLSSVPVCTVISTVTVDIT